MPRSEGIRELGSRTPERCMTESHVTVMRDVISIQPDLEVLQPERLSSQNGFQNDSYPCSRTPLFCILK